MLLFHSPLLEVYHLEWPCLSPYQKVMFCTLVCGRWDPSWIYFLGFLLCQNKFQVEITYMYTPTEKDSLTLSSLLLLHPQSLSCSWWSSLDTAADSWEMLKCMSVLASVVALATDGRREWDLCVLLCSWSKAPLWWWGLIPLSLLYLFTVYFTKCLILYWTLGGSSEHRCSPCLSGVYSLVA